MQPDKDDAPLWSLEILLSFKMVNMRHAVVTYPTLCHVTQFLCLKTRLQLPRKVDVSSQTLSKLDSATWKMLDSSVASSWRTELDCIRQTKVTHPTTTSSLANVPIQNRIHDRMCTDSDAFDAQLLSAKTVKGLLSNMTRSVNSLNHAIFDPEVNCS